MSVCKTASRSKSCFENVSVSFENFASFVTQRVCNVRSLASHPSIQHPSRGRPSDGPLYGMSECPLRRNDQRVREREAREEKNGREMFCNAMDERDYLSNQPDLQIYLFIIDLA